MMHRLACFYFACAFLDGKLLAFALVDSVFAVHDEPHASKTIRTKSDKSVAHLTKAKQSINEDGRSLHLLKRCNLPNDIAKFVINAETSSARWAAFSQSALKLGFDDVCRVQADLTAKCHRGIDSVTGTSHRKVWQHIVMNNVSLALVFEDDAFGEISDDFCDWMQRLVRESHSYDLARLHVFYGGKESMFPQLKLKAGLSRRLDDCRSGSSMLAYFVTLRGARLSLEGYSGSAEFPIDHLAEYSTAHQMNFKCVSPPIMNPQHIASYRLDPGKPHFFRVEYREHQEIDLPFDDRSEHERPEYSTDKRQRNQMMYNLRVDKNASTVNWKDDADALPDCGDKQLLAQCSA